MDRNEYEILNSRVDKARNVKMFMDEIDKILPLLDDEDRSIRIVLTNQDKLPVNNITDLFKSSDKEGLLRRYIREPLFRALLDLRQVLQSEFDSI